MFSYDFHTHILPGIDDGSPDVETSVRMIRALQKQGVENIVLTPHYYPERESVAEFLARRQESYETLMASPEAASFPPMLLGAEVRLVRDLAQIADIKKLCIGDTRLMLLEFPYLKHDNWMMQEVENMTYQLNIVPVLAHIDRFLTWKYMTEAQIDKVLEFEEAIIQINNEALEERSGRKLLKKLLKRGEPFLLGSDTHDMDNRPPNFEKMADFLRKFDYEQPEI